MSFSSEAAAIAAGRVLPVDTARDVQMLLDECDQHRIIGLLGDELRIGLLQVGDAHRLDIEARLSAWLAHSLRVEDVLRRAVSILSDIGIDHRVLKGTALAHTAYRDPSLRVFGDADLLVRSQQFSVAASALEDGLGGTRAFPQLRRGFDERFGREILLRVQGVELDLHRTLVDGPYGLWVDLDELWEQPQEFLLGATPLLALSTDAQLIHACLAAVLGDWPPRLIPLRDIAELLSTPALDSKRVLALAQSWRATGVVARAIVDMTETLGLQKTHQLVAWAREQGIGRIDRMLLRAYRTETRGYTSQALSLLAIPGARDRAAYVRALLSPDPAYRSARGLGRGGLAGRAWQRRRGHTSSIR